MELISEVDINHCRCPSISKAGNTLEHTAYAVASWGALNLARCIVVCFALPKNSCAFSSGRSNINIATSSVLAHFNGLTASGLGHTAYTASRACLFWCSVPYALECRDRSTCLSMLCAQVCSQLNMFNTKWVHQWVISVDAWCLLLNIWPIFQISVTYTQNSPRMDLESFFWKPINMQN